MKKKHSIGAVLALEAVVLVLVFCFNLIMISGVSGLAKSLIYFIDTPSLLLIVLVVAPALFVSGMGRDFLNAFSVGKREYSLRQLKRCLEAVQMVQKMIICGTAMSGIISDSGKRKYLCDGTCDRKRKFFSRQQKIRYNIRRDERRPRQAAVFILRSQA